MASKSKKSEVDIHHEKLINGLLNQMKIIFESSEQPIYLYLDDKHWVCNNNFVSFLGYKSPEDLFGQESPFVDAFVSDKSQDSLAAAYGNAMEKMIGSAIAITWKKSDGRTVDTNVILVPVAYDEHLMALHFLSPAL
jgi:hypothetical protein